MTVLASQENTNENNIFYNRVDGYKWNAQTFAVPAGQTWHLTGFEVLLSKYNSNFAGDITCMLCGTAAGTPDQTNILDLTIIPSDGVPVSPTSAWISFSSSWTLTAGTYAIILVASLSVSSCIWYSKFSGVDPYPGGKYWDNANSGGWNSYTSYHDFAFRVNGSTGVQKPVNPTPADGTGPGVDFYGWTFSWQDGGGAETYNLYAGDSPFSLNLAAQLAAISYLIPVGSPFRNNLLGGIIYWRVDAVAGDTTVTGDVWSFDPRPAKAINPAPTDAAMGQRLNLPYLVWEAG